MLDPALCLTICYGFESGSGRDQVRHFGDWLLLNRALWIGADPPETRLGQLLIFLSITTMLHRFSLAFLWVRILISVAIYHQLTSFECIA